ncbi:hypothetical protein ACHHYP_03940 [Achlya hypogyna]|uniref:Uncharacterized protein n=1 Tax=Achlya hypogyna TaxID=1202772 RepID=A0A1V9ZPJ8_ACHHY|nr:hypothetical protein ACHHYP_03940 [Achlya hypogyna]
MNAGTPLAPTRPPPKSGDAGGRVRNQTKSLSIVPSAEVATPPSRQNQRELTSKRHTLLLPHISNSATDVDGNNTFITNLPKKDTEEIRPPSPFEEEREESTAIEPENYFGLDALSRFWKMFQRQESNSRSKRPRPRSARTTYLQRLQELRRCPEPLGIIRKCEAPIVDLHAYRMGSEFATAMGESLSLIPGIDSLNLAANRISDTAASNVIANLMSAPVLKSLDLSTNSLGLQAAKALASFIPASKTLVYLNLAHNQLNSRAIIQLCDGALRLCVAVAEIAVALKKSSSLTQLNISENCFSTPGMLAIAKLLDESAKIEELYLSWNKIRGVGAQRIVEAIGYHNSLRVLDLSWNSLNSCAHHAVATTLATALTNNKVLMHLDLSNNGLDLEDCTILANALVTNHTVLGLHMVGNQAYVDAKGFVIPSAEPIHLQAQHKVSSIDRYERFQGSEEASSYDHLWHCVDRKCWLCGRWSEYRFVWTPPHSIDPKAKVELHLSIDDWNGDVMSSGPNDTYILYRMLPPGKTQYFITVSTDVMVGCFKRSALSRRSTPGHASSLPTKMRTVRQFYTMKDKRASRILRQHGDEDVFGTLHYANFIAMSRSEDTNPCRATIPRPGGNQIKVPKWDIKKSVFASRYKESPSKAYVDTDALVAKAFLVDFKLCKIDRIIRDALRKKELETIGVVYYRVISNLYRTYCNRGNPGRLTAIDSISVSWSGFLEFITDAKLVDETSERCKISDMDNVFVAANLEVTEEAKQADNPDRSLTRFEFLECIIRIAINKYCTGKNSVCETPAQAFEKIMQEHLVPMTPQDSNDFRNNYLYTEAVSDCLVEYVVMLKELYQENSGKFCKVGDVKGMTIQEFITLLERFNVFDDKFKVRDVREPFFASKMMILDEMASSSQKKIIYFTDFLELLLRVALLRYPPPTESVPDAVRSLEELFLQHFCAKDQLVATFRNTAEKAIAAKLLTNAIGGSESPPRSRGSRRTSRKTLGDIMSPSEGSSSRQPSR